MWPFRSRPRPGDEPSEDRGRQTQVWTGREKDMTLTRAYRAIVCELSEQKQAFDRMVYRFADMEKQIVRLGEALDKLGAAPGEVKPNGAGLPEATKPAAETRA